MTDDLTLHVCARCRDCNKQFAEEDPTVLEAKIGMHETFGCGNDRGFIRWEEWKK